MTEQVCQMPEMHWLVIDYIDSFAIVNIWLVALYGDGAGNTVEQNSSVFSLNRMR